MNPVDATQNGLDFMSSTCTGYTSCSLSASQREPDWQMVSQKRVRGSNTWCKSGFVGLCGLNVTFLLLLIHRRFGFNALAALGGVLVGSLSSDYYMNTSQHHRSPITQYSPRSTSVWVVFRQRESVRGEDEMKAEIKEAI